MKNNATRTGRSILALVLSAPLIAFACEPETRKLPSQTQTGCFVDGALHGPGTVRFSNGDLYEGSFDLGRRAGTGTMRFADGRRYTGAWADDRPEGQGVFTYPNGDRYEGSYHRGPASWPGRSHHARRCPLRRRVGFGPGARTGTARMAGWAHL